MPAAGEIVERNGGWRRTWETFPLDDDGFTRVKGYVAEEFDSTSPTMKGIKRHVSAPSLGGKTPAEARAFAAAINAAAAWAETAELEVKDAI